MTPTQLCFAYGTKMNLTMRLQSGRSKAYVVLFIGITPSSTLSSLDDKDLLKYTRIRLDRMRKILLKNCTKS